MRPSGADYTFFYNILQQYVQYYGSDKKVEELPAMSLFPAETLETCLKRIKKQADLYGWVIFEMPILLAYVTPNGTILEVQEEEKRLMIGKIEGGGPTSKLIDGTRVYDVRIGYEDTWSVNEEEILYFGNVVEEIVKTKDIWNVEYYEQNK